MSKSSLNHVEVRAATGEDAADIAEVYLSSRKKCLPFAPLAHSDDGVRHWIETILIPKSDVDVAIHDGQIVGMCATLRIGELSWIDQLYLRPGHVGNGIGTILLQKALEKLNRPVRLYTFQENKLACKFYERFGFVAIEFGDGTGNEEGVPDVLYELK